MIVAWVLWYGRRLRALVSLPHILAIAIWLGPFAAWSAAAASGSVDSGDIATTWQQQVGSILLGVGFDFSDRVEVFFRTFVNLLPWLPLAPLLWKSSVYAELPDKEARCFRAVRNALITCLVLNIILPGSYARYMLPALPIFCLLVARVFPIEFRLSPARPTDRLLLPCAYLLIVVPIVIAAVRAGFSWKAAMLTACGIVLAVVLRRLHPPRSAVGLAMGFAALITLAALNFAVFQAEVREPIQSRRIWGDQINEILPPGETLYAFDPGNQIFLFYIREPLAYCVKPDEVDEDVEYLLADVDLYDALSLDERLAARNPETLLEFSYRTRGRFRLLRLR
jgi:hypothetical protein